MFLQIYLSIFIGVYAKNYLLQIKIAYNLFDVQT